MKKPFSVLKKMVMFSIAGMGLFSLLSASPCLAEPAINQQNFNGSNPLDPFSQGTEDDPFSFFQLIHNANFGTFNREGFVNQGQQIDEAAAEFRAKQQQLFQQSQQPVSQPGLQVTTPQQK